MSSLARLLPALHSDYGRLLISGKLWTNLRPTRSIKTDAPPSEEVTFLGEEEETTSPEEARIRKIRDISRLRSEHRNIVHHVVPTEEKTLPMHFTVRYNKRLFGRYGYASGVEPAICWPTKAELEDKKEHESIAYPYSILEVAEREAAKRHEEALAQEKRDEQVAANVKTMLKMKAEFLRRTERQKEEAEANKAFKMRIIEEVRLHFNYAISERDERFRLEVRERAKQLKEQEKKEKKMIKKERIATQKAINFEEAAKKLKEDEERKLSAKKSEE